MKKLKDLNIFWSVVICFILVLAIIWGVAFGISSLFKDDTDFVYQGITGDFENTSPVPDPKELVHKHSFIVFDNVIYVIRVGFIDDFIVRADFYNFEDYSHKYALRLSYDENNRLSSGMFSVFNEEGVREISSTAMAYYDDNGNFSELIFIGEGDVYNLTIKATKDNEGKDVADISLNHRLTTRVTLLENGLIESSLLTNLAVLRKVDCVYDENSRLVSATETFQERVLTWDFYYEDSDCCFSRVSAAYEGYDGAVVTRNDYHEVLSYDYHDKDIDSTETYRYDDFGVQFVETMSIIRPKEELSVVIDYSDNLGIERYYESKLVRDNSQNGVQNILEYANDKNGNRTYSYIERLYWAKNIITEQVVITETYDKLGQLHGLLVKDTKKFDMNQNLIYHLEDVEEFENGKWCSSFTYNHLKKENVNYSEEYPKAWKVTTNEYADKKLTKTIITMYADSQEKECLYTEEHTKEIDDLQIEHHYQRRYDPNGVMILFSYALMDANTREWISELYQQFDSNGTLTYENICEYYCDGVHDKYEINPKSYIYTFYYEDRTKKQVERYALGLPIDPYEHIITEYDKNGEVIKETVNAIGVYDEQNNVVGRKTYEYLESGSSLETIWELRGETWRKIQTNFYDRNGNLIQSV